MRRLLQRKLCRRKTLLFTLFLLSLIIGTTPASAKEVTDVLTKNALIGTNTGYTTFPEKKFPSGAGYAGKIAGDGGTIQMTNKTAQASFIATTGSGGVLKKIKLYWNTTKTTDSSTSPRKLSIYAQDNPYTTTYSDNKVGTNVSTLQYAKDNPISEYTFDAEYTYIALFAINGACYFDKIEITWEDGTTSEPQNFDSAHDQFTGLTWNDTSSAYDLTMTYGDTFTLTPKSSTPPTITYAIADGKATDVVSIEGNKLTAIKAGTTTITASWAADDNWNAGSRDINVTVNHAPECGDITFTPAAGEVARGTEVTLSCENATEITYTVTPTGGTASEPTTVNANTAKVTINEACTISATAKNKEGVGTTEFTAGYTITAAPLCGDITFSPADGSVVDAGSKVTISCENAAKITYTVITDGVAADPVVVAGASTQVTINAACTIKAKAENADGVATEEFTASYTLPVMKEYTLFTDYGADNSVPEGDYIFVGKGTSSDEIHYYYMEGQNDKDEYRIATEVTPVDGVISVKESFEIHIQKESDSNYSLITKDGKYLYDDKAKLKEGTDTKWKGIWTPSVKDGNLVFKTGSNSLCFNASSPRFKTYSSIQAYFSLYAPKSDALGDIKFSPAPGSEVPINSTVKISCKNATQISYSITKNEGSSTTVVVPGSVAEVTITEDCIIEAKGTNDEGDSDIADAIYTVQEPFTLYTDFYEETGAPYIPDGDYVLVGSVSSGESAGEYYMAEQKDTYRVANKIQPLEDGRLPIDNKYHINIKKEDSGNYSLTTADGKYIYAAANYSVKEGEAAAGQGKWKANIKNGKVYFSWADPSYGDFKFNPQSPRFKTYDPKSTNLVSFSLYSTNIPLCRDLKFDHADRSSVVRGSSVTISCINAAKIFYSVDSPFNVTTVEGNKASVIISDDCMISAYAVNAAGVRSGDEISAFYTVIDPYVQFTGYGSNGSVPDGKYLFVGQNATTGALSYMAEEDVDSNGSVYRNAVKVTPFVDGRIGVNDKYAITVKKEEGANYSLITADGKYLYASTFTPTSGEGESQTTTYSVIGGDADLGQGQWTANVEENKVEFAWSNPDMGTLRYLSGENSRFKTYPGSTGTKFYLYAPTPKPAQVVCTDATIINKEIKIAVNKTITFHSEGAGKMACEILEEDEERNSVETFDIVDGDTYVFTTSPKATYQVVNIIPYDQYGAAHTPSSLCVGVTTFNLPKISYNFVDGVDGEDKAAFYADNGTITEIRPYRIDGTLEEAGTYPDNVITFRFSQPRFKVTAQNEIGDVVEESFSFIQELCERNNIEGGAYSVVINYKNANSAEVASFPIAETALGSLNWTMDGYLVNESDDLLETYPFLIKESYITLHIAPYNSDGPTILNVKIATPADGGEGVYGAPAHAPAAGDLVATVGNYNFVVNGGSPLYFDGQDKNFIKGNIEVSPFEYANISITSIDDVTTEVSDILDEDAEEVFYNLQGVRVENPDKGIYIRVKGNKTEKILK